MTRTRNAPDSTTRGLQRTREVRAYRAHDSPLSGLRSLQQKAAGVAPAAVVLGAGRRRPAARYRIKWSPLCGATSTRTLSSCPLPSRAPARASPEGPVRGARGGRLRGWHGPASLPGWVSSCPGSRPGRARSNHCRPSGRRRGRWRGPGLRRIALRRLGLPRLGHFARVPAAVSLRRGGRCGVPARLRAVAGGFKALGPLEPRPRPFRRFRRGLPGRRLGRHRPAALPGPAVAIPGRRGRPFGACPRWRSPGVPPAVPDGAAAPPGSQGRGPARTTAEHPAAAVRAWRPVARPPEAGQDLCQLLVDLPGPLPGLGELGGPGEGLADALAGVIDLAAGAGGVSEDGGLAVLQVVEPALEAGSPVCPAPLSPGRWPTC